MFYGKRLAGLDGKIAELEGEIDSLEQKVRDLVYKVGEMSIQLDSLIESLMVQQQEELKTVFGDHLKLEQEPKPKPKKRKPKKNYGKETPESTK